MIIYSMCGSKEKWKHNRIIILKIFSFKQPHIHSLIGASELPPRCAYECDCEVVQQTGDLVRVYPAFT